MTAASTGTTRVDDWSALARRSICRGRPRSPGSPEDGWEKPEGAGKGGAGVRGCARVGQQGGSYPRPAGGLKRRLNSC
jgi:hypothetical protein